MALFQAAWSPEFFRQKGAGGEPLDGTGLQGLYQIGGYFFGGYDGLTNYSGGTRGNGYGFWIQGQQMVWRDPDALYRYASVWAGLQYSPVQSVSTMPWMVYGGIQLQGFVPYRSRDGLYFSWLYGSFNSNYGYGKGAASYSATYEMVVEATYVIQLNEHVSIQPDLQYIFRQRKQRHRRRPRPRRPADSIVLVAPPVRRGKLYRDYALHVLFKA